MNLSQFLSSSKHEKMSLRFEQLPFNHPLFILYSSSPSGSPKCIVHSAGVCIHHSRDTDGMDDVAFRDRSSCTAGDHHLRWELVPPGYKAFLKICWGSRVSDFPLSWKNELIYLEWSVIALGTSSLF